MDGESLEQRIRDIRGCLTAMVTPFDERSEVDTDGLRKNLRFQISNGIAGVVPLGTTGESSTVTEEEFKIIIGTAVDEVKGRVPVIAGAGSNSTEKTVHSAKMAEELGADAVLIVTPYYNKPTQEGIYRHFEKVSSSTNLPIIVYNIASRSGVNIETRTLLRLSGLERVVGVKEASGSISQIADVVGQMPRNFLVLSGDDGVTLPLISLGGHGVISVASNILPKRVSDMVSSALGGDMQGARRMNGELMPIFRDQFIETNPIPIKTAMRILGMPSGGFRLPLCDMMPQNAERLRKTLSMYSELKERMVV